MNKLFHCCSVFLTFIHTHTHNSTGTIVFFFLFLFFCGKLSSVLSLHTKAYTPWSSMYSGICHWKHYSVYKDLSLSILLPISVCYMLPRCYLVSHNLTPVFTSFSPFGARQRPAPVFPSFSPFDANIFFFLYLH